MQNIITKSILTLFVYVAISVSAHALELDTEFDVLEAPKVYVTAPTHIEMSHFENEELNTNTLSWDAIDSDDIIFYEIYRKDITNSKDANDFILIDMVRESSFTDWDVTDNVYEYKVITVNAYGSHSEPSDTAR